MSVKHLNVNSKCVASNLLPPSGQKKSVNAALMYVVSEIQEQAHPEE